MPGRIDWRPAHATVGQKIRTCPFSVLLYSYPSVRRLVFMTGSQIDTRGSGGAGPFSLRSVKLLMESQTLGESMRKGKKALLIAAAMILTIATLAVLNFVRSKMEADEPAAKTA